MAYSLRSRQFIIYIYDYNVTVDCIDYCLSLLNYKSINIVKYPQFFRVDISFYNAFSLYKLIKHINSVFCYSAVYPLSYLQK